MELVLAILMVLGIFIGIPALIGFAIVGGFALHYRRINKVKHIEAAKKAEAIVKEPTKEHVLVA